MPKSKPHRREEKNSRRMEIDRVIRTLAARRDGKIIIAIDGFSGSGKTTFLKRLAQRNRAILPVYIDDFINTRKKRRALLRAAKDKTRVMELEWNNVRKIRQLLRAYRTSDKKYSMVVYNPKTDRYDRIMYFDLSKKILVLEGIFLFHPKLYKNAFDIRIFLDIDAKLAEARRVKREKKRWGNNYVPETRSDSFIKLFKITYSKYVKKHRPKQLADYVIKVK